MAGAAHHVLPPPSFEDPAPKILIVVAPYYADVAADLLAGARAAIKGCGAVHETAEVPGALEIPTAIGIAHRIGAYDGYVALGCVVRGETTHYDTVCADSSRGLTTLGLSGACVGNGILTVETMDQARVRAGEQDKGGGAALAALHLVALTRRMGRPPRDVGFRRGDLHLAKGGETV